MRRILSLQSVHATGGIYSHAVAVGSTVYIAGQVSLDRYGKLVGQGEPDVQVRQVLNNLYSILAELGGGFENVVKYTTYLTDRAYLPAFRLVRDEVLGRPIPVNTLVFVSGLASPEYLVEIDAIAHLPLVPEGA